MAAVAGYRSTLAHLALTPASRILFQNLTGRAATMHARLSVQHHRTNLVAGTSSKQAGSEHEELKVPLFANVREAKRHTDIDATAVFVPPHSAADAIIEAIEEEIPLIVAVAEGIPTRDQMLVMSALQSQSKSRLLGANSPGYTSPYGPRLGIAPVAAAMRGCVGIAARSGTLSYEAMGATQALGLGQSAVLGLGGDFYPGTRTDEALEFLLSDPATSGIILIGEVGGTMEEDAAAYLLAQRSPPFKPIVGFIAGRGVPAGRSYGHAGAVWSGDVGSAEAKREAWRRAGIRVVDTVGETAQAIKEEMEALQCLPAEPDWEKRRAALESASMAS